MMESDGLSKCKDRNKIDPPKAARFFGPGAPAWPRYHHYVFELYALSGTLDLPPTATRAPSCSTP